MTKPAGSGRRIARRGRVFAVLVVAAVGVGLLPGVSVAASPDFSVALNPSAATVSAGASASTKVSTLALGGFVGDVAFTASGLPLGAAALFSVAQARVGDSLGLTITTSSSTPAGTYPVTVTATQVISVVTVGPIVHTADFALTVQAASVKPPAVSPGLTGLFAASYAKFIRGVWKQPLPPICAKATTASCTISYANLPLPNWLKSVVVLAPLPAPHLTLETFHFEGIVGHCNADGNLLLNGATGIADGPFPGTVHFGTSDNGIYNAGGPFGIRNDLSAFYTIDSPGLTTLSLSTGLLSARLIFGNCGAPGVGAGSFDAAYTYYGSPPLEDAGTTQVAVSASGGLVTLDITLDSTAGLPGSASLPPPTPVCPASGCP